MELPEPLVELPEPDMPLPLEPEEPVERGLVSEVPEELPVVPVLLEPVVPLVPVWLRFACFFTYDSQAFWLLKLWEE